MVVKPYRGIMRHARYMLVYKICEESAVESIYNASGVSFRKLVMIT